MLIVWIQLHHTEITANAICPLQNLLEPPSVVDFLGGSDSKESTCQAGDPGSSPGLGRSPGEGTGNPLQYACLGIPMDRGAWRVTVHGVTKELDTT